MKQEKSTYDIITIMVVLSVFWIMGAIFFGGENWLFPR